LLQRRYSWRHHFHHGSYTCDGAYSSLLSIWCGILSVYETYFKELLSPVYRTGC
jgi:hypothetical protein